MPKTPINAPVERAVLNKEGFLTIRKKLSSEVQTVFTAHDTYIGVIGNEADLTVNGALAVTKGATGVYKFPDGTCSIREGENTSVILNSDGSVTIDTVEGRDIGELLAIANSVQSRMDTVESQFAEVQQGFVQYTSTVDTMSSQFAGVVSGFNVLSSSVSTYDSRINAAEASVSNVLAAEAAQNTQISSLRTALNNEVTARITQGTNLLADLTRIDGKVTQLSSSLNQSIMTISSSLVTSINSLSGSVASRVTRLEFASSSFSSSISSLSSSFFSSVLSLSSSLSNTISSNYLSLESAINREVIDRQEADLLLSRSFASSLSDLSRSLASFDTQIGNSVTSLSSSLSSRISGLDTSLMLFSGSVARDINEIRSVLMGDLEIDFTAISTLSSSVSLDIADLRSSNQGILSSISSITNAISSLTGSTTSTAGVFAFNEVPQGSIDGVNNQFTLANTPSPPSSLMLFYNGQLLTVGSDADYILNGNVITFLGKSAPEQDDLLLATYFYSTPTKSYKFNEAVVFSTQGPTRHAVLDYTPDPPNSLMLFLNGQLLRMGGDYELSDKNVSTDIPEDQDDVFLATYSHN